MTRDDIDRLFRLLEIYFPNSGRTKSGVQKSAWLLLLEPFEPDEVKKALALQLRENEFFPDPQSIAVRCKKKRAVFTPGDSEIQAIRHLQKLRDELARADEDDTGDRA